MNKTPMSQHNDSPATFVDMVLQLLEDRFPWLRTDEEASGADTVELLNELHQELKDTQLNDKPAEGAN
jgi:hypothetical protein